MPTPETVSVSLTELEIHEALLALRYAALPERQPVLLPLIGKLEKALEQFDHGRTRGFSLYPRKDT